MDMEKLARQNPWWSNGNAIKEDEKVRKVLETGERITQTLGDENQVLIGPRQLGKTTALKYDIYKRIIKHGADPSSMLYYSFDTARNLEEISDVLDTFADGKDEKTVYLDEVSFVEGWQKAVKLFLDSEKSASTRMYITGSSSINLKKELMPGRKMKFIEFLPLSFREFLMSFGSKELKRTIAASRPGSLEEAIAASNGLITHFGEISKDFGVYLKTGGYPDAIFEHLAKGRVSDELYDVHWNAFVSDISKAGKSAEIATAVVYGIVESYSSKINLSKIARMQGIKSHVTVREYIETLEDLFAARSVFPLAGRRYVFRKERKIYFSDPFLYWMFSKKMNISDKESESKVAEGVLYNHIYRFMNRGKAIAEPKTSVGFYSGNKEIDFVIGDLGFELKWQEKVSAGDFPDVGAAKRIILSKKTSEDGSTRILPLPLFLAVM